MKQKEGLCMNIIEFIGEATEYEKKQAVERKKVRSWLKTVSAFANTSGGTLIFGITDDEEVIGLEDVKSDSEFISQKIKERISPFPEVVMRIHEEDGKDLILLEVPSGKDTPYFYVGDGVMESYIRVGNESVITTSTEMKRLVLRGNNTSFDSQITEYDFAEYSFSKLRERYRVWTGKRMPEKIYESYGLVDANGKLTNAGALIADESPIRYSRLFCTRWNGLTKSGGLLDALDSAEFTGSIIRLLDEGIRFIKGNTKKMWKKLPTSRLELPDYCERSVFEALVNALIHRDYLVNGSEVHVDIFDNRLEIYSPGGMPGGRNIQDCDIDNVPSERRNPVLADVFLLLGYMERQGSGLNKIVEDYELAANYTQELKPVFTSTRSAFFVKLWNLNYNSSRFKKPIEDENGAKNEAKNEAKKVPKSYSRSQLLLNENQKNILKFMRRNPSITQQQIMENAFLSRATLQREIKVLIERGFLERTGSARNGTWVVKKIR